MRNGGYTRKRERPGFCDGKTPSVSDHTISAKTASRLQLSRTSMPPKRPILKFPSIRRSLRFAVPRLSVD